MTIEPLDPRSDVPLYRQLIDQIRRRIALGDLGPGDRLPPVRELAERLQVNRNTAGRAVSRLEAQGLVRTRPGRGTFVAEQAPPIDRAATEARVDGLMDGLLVEAQTGGMPLEELGWRLVQRIERFRNRRRESV